jgi:TctA family transporter
MRLLDFQPAPLLLGFVLGPMMEENLRRALQIARGDYMVFIQRPVSATLLFVCFSMLAWALWKTLRNDAGGAVAGKPTLG